MATKKVPLPNKLVKQVPIATITKQPAPLATATENPAPDYVLSDIPAPLYEETKIQAPPKGHLLNQVTIDGVTILIKPTRLQYSRDQTAAFYKTLKQAPLVLIFSVDEHFFDEKKTTDKILFDWLVAVIDDPDFVTLHYDNFTQQDIDKMILIFCRLNGFELREERKNRRAQVAANSH